MSTTNLSELGYLFLALSSLHKIASDLDGRDHSCWMMLKLEWCCSAQTRTGIGLLGKPPTVKQFPSSKATRRTRLLRGPVQTQVWSEQVWLNTTFISQGSRSWDKLSVETWRVKTKLIIIITILHIIIITISILNLRLKQLRQKYWRILQCINTETYTNICSNKNQAIHKLFALLKK